MRLFPQHEGSVVILAPHQRLDHACANDFQEALQPWVSVCHADGKALLLDLAGVPYISSIALRVLMMAAKQVQKQGGQLVMSGLQPVVKEVFEISGFHQYFRIYSCCATAMTALDARKDEVCA